MVLHVDPSRQSSSRHPQWRPKKKRQKNRPARYEMPAPSKSRISFEIMSTIKRWCDYIKDFLESPLIISAVPFEKIILWMEMTFFWGASSKVAHRIGHCRNEEEIPREMDFHANSVRIHTLRVLGDDVFGGIPCVDCEISDCRTEFPGGFFPNGKTHNKTGKEWRLIRDWDKATCKSKIRRAHAPQRNTLHRSDMTMIALFGKIHNEITRHTDRHRISQRSFAPTTHETMSFLRERNCSEISHLHRCVNLRQRLNAIHIAISLVSDSFWDASQCVNFAGKAYSRQRNSERKLINATVRMSRCFD